MRRPTLAHILEATGWLAGWWLLWRLPPPGPDPRRGPSLGQVPAPGRRLSVIIPARNEERSLPNLLRSLAAQTAPPLEVIVVDDHSADATGALAAQAGATVLAGEALPSGWTGKTWACHQGAARARGELLCFLDADVTLAPDALARLEGEHDRRAGLVSVQPFHVTERLYESLSATCNVVELMGTGAFSAPPQRPAAMAFGPCLLLRRVDYVRLGGHSHPDVRALVAEDVGLAARCRAEGIAVTALAGRDVVAFRMYPDGPRQLAEGWTKMLAYGARHTPPALGLGVGAWITAGLMAARALGARDRRAVWRLADYAGWSVQAWWMLRRVGRFHWLAVLAWPVPLGAFVTLFARSALARVSGRAPRWRGRDAPRA